MASRIDPGALIASALAHCVLVACGAVLWAGRALHTPPAEEVEVVMDEAPPAQSGNAAPGGDARSLEAPREPNADVEPPKPRGSSVARPDQARSGRGGQRQGERATNLASNIDPLTLERDPLNHFRRSEVQRLRSGRVRRSWDDRRATPHPMELDFVASGRGRVAAHRPFASSSPDRGALHGSVPVPLGAVLGAAPLPDGWNGEPGASQLGGEPRDPAGLAGRARGSAHYLHAEVMTARPSVPATRAAVPAVERELPSDTVESRQRVASRVVALMQASTLGGDSASGVGGSEGPELPAVGQGSGAGARAEPWGQGEGRGDPDSDRDEAFFRRMKARIEAALRDTFPNWAILEGRGGVVIFDLALGGDGHIERVALVRRSGIDEYDQNVLRAVRGIGGFGPVPAGFRSGVRFTYDSRNPVVGRRGPGPGRVAN